MHVHLVSGFYAKGTTFCIAPSWAPELRGPVVPAVGRVRYFHFSVGLFSEQLLISAFLQAQPSGRPQCPFHGVVVKVTSKWLCADEMVRAKPGTQQALSNPQLLAGWQWSLPSTITNSQQTSHGKL